MHIENHAVDLDDTCDNNCDNAQERLGRGEFNSETTRVLHLVRNPEAEQERQDAVERIEQLALENNALRSQLQQLEALKHTCFPETTGHDTDTHGVATALAEAEIAIAKRKVPQLLTIACPDS